MPPLSTSRVRFGVLELDVKTRELHHEGQTVVLQEQPFRVLLLLLERGSEVVTREDIKSKLWPNDTMVDFDRGINAAVKNLRRALSDSPDTPNYIQTLPRLGYRLLAPVSGSSPRPRQSSASWKRMKATRQVAGVPSGPRGAGPARRFRIIACWK